MSVCKYVHVNASAQGGQRGHHVFLDLELQEVKNGNQAQDLRKEHQGLLEGKPSLQFLLGKEDVCTMYGV